MTKKLLTISDLVNFCETYQFNEFSSKKSGFSLAVQIPTTYESTEENSADGLMRLKIKTSHTLLNENRSFIKEEVAKKAMSSLKMRPVLAAIHQLSNGEYDFDSHNMEIVTNENGEEEINYIEKQVGAFTQEKPFLEYDEKQDKTYICAYAMIPESYTPTASIIRRKGGTKVSCEILIYSFSYNAKEKYLEIQDYRYEGVTLLGTHVYSDGTETEVKEGMLGSRADIEDFSVKNNSLFTQKNLNEKLVDTLEKLNSTLLSFNIQNSKEGGHDMNKLEELLNKYGKTQEDISFEIEGLSDEELEAKFAELFEVTDDEPDDTSSEDDETSEPTETAKDNEPEVIDDDKKKKTSNSKKYEVLENGDVSVTFELSHEDIRSGLYALIEQFEELDNDWYWISVVYDDRFVFEGCRNGSIYGCKYIKDGDNISLDGERYKLYREFLTESEKVELETMRSNYTVLQEKVNSYEAEALNAEKDKVFAEEHYQTYLETKEFKELITNKSQYSVAELKDKAEIAFAKCVREIGQFDTKESNKITRKQFGLPSKEHKKNPYGTILKDK